MLMAALAASQELDLLQYVCIFLALGSPKLNMVLQVQSRTQMQSHTCQIEGNNHFNQPAKYTLANTAHNAVGVLCCESPWLSYVLLLVLWYP